MSDRKNSRIILEEFWISNKIYSIMILSYLLHNFTNQIFMGIMSLIDCDRATYYKWKVDKEFKTFSLDTHMIGKYSKVITDQVLDLTQTGSW